MGMVVVKLTWIGKETMEGHHHKSLRRNDT